MSSSSNMKKSNADDSIEQEFEGERRKKVITGIVIAVVAIAATIGIFYYFGAMSASW